MTSEYVVGTLLGFSLGLLGSALMLRHQVVMARAKLRLEKIEQTHKVLSLVARHAAILRDRYLALGLGDPLPAGTGSMLCGERRLTS